MEEDSSLSVGDTTTATERSADGPTVIAVDVNQPDSDLLLRQPFTKSGEEFIIGEVSPREQDEGGVPGGSEMVVPADHTPAPPSEERSGRSHQITEENDSGESQLVPGAGFNGNDRLQMVSKDWVLDQIERQVSKAQESNSQKISSLQDQMTQMNIKFDEQIKEKDKQLQCKQRELDQCQAELDDCKKQVENLQEKLTSETEARAEAEQVKSELEENMKHKEKKIRKLKQEIEALNKRAERAERREEILEEVTQHLIWTAHHSPGTHHAPSPPSPTEPRTFQSLHDLHPHGEVHNSGKMVFSPRPSIDGLSDDDSV